MSRAGLTLLYAGHVYFEDLPLPGWAPQPNWQLAFAAAAAELTDNHWIDDLKVRAALLHLVSGCLNISREGTQATLTSCHATKLL